MMRFALLLSLALLGIPGCFTGRLALAPTVASDGLPGIDVKATGGMGWGDDEQGVFLLGGVGYGQRGGAPGLVLDGGIDYVSQRGARSREDGVPFRAGLRWGARIVEDEDGERAQLGGAVALFPWSTKRRSSGEHHEKMGSLFPTTATYRNLGVEVAVLRVFSSKLPDIWLISIGLAIDWTSMLD